MSIAYVQGIQNRSLTTIALTSVGGGNFLILSENSSNAIISIVDSTGDTWTEVSTLPATGSGGFFNSDMWYAKNVTTGTHTLTLTMTNGLAPWHELYEFSGVDHTTPVYGIAKIDNQNGTTDHLLPSLTSTANADMLFAGVETGSTCVISSPWTPAPFVTGGNGQSAYYLPGVAGAYQANNTGAQNFCSSGVVIKTAGSVLTKTLTDTITLSDGISFLATILLTLSDSISVAETKSFGMFLTLNDFIFKIDDLEGTITARTLKDSILLQEWLSLDHYPPKSDFGD